MRVSLSELRHRITLLCPVTDTDDEGNILSSSVQEFARAWALVLPFAATISDGYAEKVQEVDWLYNKCCGMTKISSATFIFYSTIKDMENSATM